MLEKSIIASAMFDSEIIEHINPKWFTDQKLKIIAEALIEIGINDIVAVHKKTNIEIDELTNISEHFETYSIALNRINNLKKEYKNREVSKILDNAKNDLDNVSLSEISNRIDKINFEDEENDSDEGFKSIILNLAEELNQPPREKENELYNFPIPKLNYYLYQLEKKWLVTIAAKSSKGKTAFSMQLALEYMKKGLKVLIISREMSKSALVKRMIQNDLELQTNVLKSRRFTKGELDRVTDLLFKRYSKFKSWIDTSSMTVNQIETKIKKYNPDIIFIDYIQLLKTPGGNSNREREVASVSRDLKNLSMIYDIPVVVMAQLNDNMGYHRPKGDTPMRESKAIYHDSNVVIYIHEPIKEELNEYDDDVAVNTDKIKLMEVIVDKNRDGSTGKIPVYFIKQRLKFIEIKED